MRPLRRPHHGRRRYFRLWFLIRLILQDIPFIRVKKSFADAKIFSVCFVNRESFTWSVFSCWRKDLTSFSRALILEETRKRLFIDSVISSSKGRPASFSNTTFSSSWSYSLLCSAFFTISSAALKTSWSRPSRVFLYAIILWSSKYWFSISQEQYLALVTVSDNVVLSKGSG